MVTLGTNFSEVWIQVHHISHKKRIFWECTSASCKCGIFATHFDSDIFLITDRRFPLYNSAQVRFWGTMTSSNADIFRVPGPLWGESTLTKASDVGLWCLLWCAPEQTFQSPSRRLNKRFSRHTGDLWCHGALCDVTVMDKYVWFENWPLIDSDAPIHEPIDLKARTCNEPD